MAFPSIKNLFKCFVGAAWLADSVHAVAVRVPHPSPGARFKSITATVTSNFASTTAANPGSDDTASIPFLSTVTGPGPSSIYECWSSSKTYLLEQFPLFPILAEFDSEQNISRPQEITHILPYSDFWTTYVNASVPHTTLCDGHPRYLAPVSTGLMLTYTNASATEVSFPSPTANPECEVSESECTTVLSVWSEAYVPWSSAYEPFMGWMGWGFFYNEPFGPFCTTTDKACTASRCLMVANTATVFYWPTSTINGDVCGESGTTMTPTATVDGIPNTAVFQSETLTSPTAYVIIDTVQVYSSAPKGEPYTDISACGSGIPPQVTLSIHPRDLSSVRYYLSSSSSKYDFEASSYTYPLMVSSTLPFNFADMDVEQRSWEAYAGAFSFWDQPAWEGKGDDPVGLRTTHTMSAEFSPYLAVPKVMTELGAAGEYLGCELDDKIESVIYVPITGVAVDVPSSTWLVSTVGADAMETRMAPLP